MLLSQHICISHWPYCLGVHLSQLKGCSHWGGSEFNPLQSRQMTEDKPQNQEWLGFGLFLTDLFIPSFLLSGIGSMTWQVHFQKCFTWSGCHPCCGRKFILLPFLCKLQLKILFCGELQDHHSLILRVFHLVGCVQLVGWYARNLGILTFLSCSMQPFLVAAVVWVCSGSFSESAVASEGGTGDFSPETALQAALARGQTSCSELSCWKFQR